MPVICPKCSHVRPADASNPEWQCPSCGVCYAKVAGRSSEPVRPLRKTGTAGAQGPRLGWLLLALPLLAIGWGMNAYIERRGLVEAEQALTVLHQKEEERAVAVLDAALQDSGLDASGLTKMPDRLAKSCAKNKYGLSQSECMDRLHERGDACSEQIQERFPGEITNTSRLQEVSTAYVACVFEEG